MVAHLQEHHALELLAQRSLLLLFLGLARYFGPIVATPIPGIALSLLLVAFLRRKVAVGAANGHALNGHHHHLLHRRGLDVGGRAHSRPQDHRSIRNADLHLEVGDLFLRPGVPGAGGAGDLAHHSMDGLVRIGVHRDPCGVAHLHVHNIILIDVDPRFHAGEIGNAHDLGPCELTGPHHSLPHSAGQRADTSGSGRVDSGLRQRFPDLAHGTLSPLDIEK